MLVSLTRPDSWFNPPALLDMASGHVTRLLENGLNDHYRCVRCAAEKDVLRGQVSSWSRKPLGRPGKVAT